MIHILLLILKIMGVILAAVLVLILLVLFYPIKYTGKVQADKSGTDGRFTAYWFLHALHFKMRFGSGGTEYTLRFLGIPVLSDKKNADKHKNEKAGKKHGGKAGKKSVHLVKKNDDGEKNRDKTKRSGKDAERKNVKDYRQKENRKNTYKDRENIKDRIIKSIKKIRDTVKGALDSAKSFKEKIKKIKDFITANTTKEAYNYGKTIIKKLLHHLFPKKISGRLHIGFDSPDKTGKALGYVAVIYSAFGINQKRMEIIPDFEKEIFQGNIKVKGRALAGVVGYYILKFYFNKDINQTIKRFNRR